MGQNRACAVRPRARPCADGPCGRCGSGLRGRDRPRTSRRSPPAAPARCRCWRSPFRGGYAVRGSAAPADKPAVRANRSTGPRSARAANASARRAPPYRRRAVRHSPSARRTAAPNRWRYRRRVRRAKPITSAPAGRRRRLRARPWRAGSRSPGAGRAPCLTCPDTAAGRRRPRPCRDRLRDRRRSTSTPKARRGCAARQASADAPRHRRRRILPWPARRVRPAPWLRRRPSPRRAARRWRRRAR